MQGLKDHEQIGRKRYALSKRRESHVMQCHIPVERNHRLYRCEQPKTRNDGSVLTIVALLSHPMAVTSLTCYLEPV